MVLSEWQLQTLDDDLNDAKVADKLLALLFTQPIDEKELTQLFHRVAELFGDRGRHPSLLKNILGILKVWQTAGD